MRFILIPVIVIVACQFIKLLILFSKEGKLSLHQIIWEGLWVGKFPSSHAALLVSSFYLIVKYSNDASVIGFSLFVCLLFLYSLLEDKKRGEMLEGYLIKSNDENLRQAVLDKKLKGFNGHGYIELFAGIILGLIFTLLLDKLFV